MKVLIIDNYDSFTYNLYQYVATLGMKIRVRKNDEFLVDDLKEYDAIIISPGPGRPGIPRDVGFGELVVKKYKNKPILGICLGHQIIGYVYGAKIERSKKIVHGKYSIIEHTNDPIFTGLGKFRGGRYHSLVISKKNFPDSLEIIAESDGEIMAIKHRRYMHYGLQFHPESILTPRGMKILKNFFMMVEDYEHP